MISKQLNGNQILVGTSSDGFFGTNPNNINVPGVLSTDTLPNAIDKLIGIIDLLAPAKSPLLSTKSLSFISGGPYSTARHVGVGGGQSLNVIYTTNTATAFAGTASPYNRVIFSNRPTVRVSDSTTGTHLATFSDGRSGVLQAKVDNNLAGTRQLNDTYHASGDVSSTDVGGWDQNGTSIGPNSLFITFDQDPFTVAPNSGFWTSLKATMSATYSFSNIDGVEHIYEMSHSTTGNTPQFKFICDSGDYIYSPTIPFDGSPFFGIGRQNPSVTRWVSGIPGLTVGDWMIATYTFSNSAIGGRYPLISRFYNQTQITRFYISDGTVNSNKGDLDASGYPVIGGTAAPYAFQPKWHVKGLSTSIVTNMFTSFSKSYSLDLFVKAYNPKGDSFDTTVYKYANYGGVAGSQVYVDTVSIEGTISGSTRVRSGNGLYPTYGSGNSQFGDSYSPLYNNISIQGNIETVASELMLQNGLFRWPAGNYTSNVPTSGSNYDSLVNTFNSTGHRFATFNVGTITSASSMIINIVGSGGFGALAVVSGITLHTRVMSGSTPVTGWLNINLAYSAGIPSNDGDAALDFGSSTSILKRVTFGATTRTGTVFVRIGLQNDGKNFSNITKS